MHYTSNETNMLCKVNKIGMELDTVPEIGLLFIALSPYLYQLTNFLKNLKPVDMRMLFAQYEGVMKVMRIIEGEAQKMEKIGEL